MKSKILLTFIFISLVSIMMWIFVYLGNKNLNIVPKAPNWSTIKNDSETLKKGFQHYQKSCSKCHGMDHEGSFEAPILNDTTWIYPNNRETLFKIISEVTPNKKMRGWNTNLKTEDIQALTLYILSLQKKELPN